MGGKSKSDSKAGAAPNVGETVWVLWPLEKSWYEGTVIDQAGPGERKVKYFLDDDVRWHNLDRGMRWEHTLEGYQPANEQHRRDATPQDLGKKAPTRRKRAAKAAQSEATRAPDPPANATEEPDPKKGRTEPSPRIAEKEKPRPAEPVDEAPQTAAQAPSTMLPNAPSTAAPEIPKGDENLDVDSQTLDEPSQDEIRMAAGLTPPPPFKTNEAGEQTSPNVRVIVLLENARLETVKAGKNDQSFQLLNCDDHRNILKKTGREPKDARPDITHQCLLSLLDSPLNKSGLLKVYIRTERNVLIEIHQNTRIPRTFRRFAGLMVELLHKLKIRATNSPEPLLKVIRGPITAHLPVGSRKIVLTYNCDNLVNIRHHAKQMGKEAAKSTSTDPLTVVYVVGAMAHGKVEIDWGDEAMSISDFPLSASTACHRIMAAYEELLEIL